MAISFQKKINYKYYITVFVVTLLVLVGLYFLFKYFIQEFIMDVPPEEPVKKEVQIDFKVLQNESIQLLTPFKEIEPLEGDIGRNNPFLIY